MVIWRLAGHREFFARRRETAEPQPSIQSLPVPSAVADAAPAAVAA
jgi:hypothetical protein